MEDYYRYKSTIIDMDTLIISLYNQIAEYSRNTHEYTHNTLMTILYGVLDTMNSGFVEDINNEEYDVIQYVNNTLMLNEIGTELPIVKHTTIYNIVLEIYYRIKYTFISIKHYGSNDMAITIYKLVYDAIPNRIYINIS